MDREKFEYICKTVKEGSMEDWDKMLDEYHCEKIYIFKNDYPDLINKYFDEKEKDCLLDELTAPNQELIDEAMEDDRNDNPKKS